MLQSGTDPEDIQLQRQRQLTVFSE